MNVKILKGLFLFLIIISLSVPLAYGIENEASVTKKEDEEPEMIVKFYNIDKKKMGKGEFLGTAKIQNDKLNVDVNSSKLKKLFTKPYTTTKGEIKDGVAVDRKVTLEPGTVEHLKAIMSECWEYGFTAEVVKNE